MNTDTRPLWRHCDRCAAEIHEGTNDQPGDPVSKRRKAGSLETWIICQQCGRELDEDQDARRMTPERCATARAWAVLVYMSDARDHAPDDADLLRIAERAILTDATSDERTQLAIARYANEHYLTPTTYLTPRKKGTTRP